MSAEQALAALQEQQAQQMQRRCSELAQLVLKEGLHTELAVARRSQDVGLAEALRGEISTLLHHHTQITFRNSGGVTK